MLAFALLNDFAAAEDVLYDVFVTFARNAHRLNVYQSLKECLAGYAVNLSRNILHNKMYKAWLKCT